jgi:hypothetical protein
MYETEEEKRKRVAVATKPLLTKLSLAGKN